MLLEGAWDQGGTAGVSATGGFPSAPVEQVKKNRANPPKYRKKNSAAFIVPLAWIELWLITLFHIQGCALKIATPPPGGSRGTMVGNRQPKSRGEGGLPPSSSASPIPSPLGSGGANAAWDLAYRTLPWATWGRFNAHVPGQ